MFSGLEPAALPVDAVEVGRIGDAFGVRGWFKVLPHSAKPEALFSSKRWFLVPSERGPKKFDGSQRLAIREAREHADVVVASAHGVDNRDQAQALRGAGVWISRASFPTPAPDEYYWVDLIGLAVVNCQGQALGTVTELLSAGAQTTLVLQDTSGAKVVDRMIPFVSVFVLEVDLPGKRILVDWQADY